MHVIFSSPSDDEVGGYKARSAPAMFAPPICRRADETPRGQSRLSDMIVSSDRTKTAAPGEHSSERSEPLDRASLASEAIERSYWWMR